MIRSSKLFLLLFVFIWANYLFTCFQAFAKDNEESRSFGGAASEGVATRGIRDRWCVWLRKISVCRLPVSEFYGSCKLTWLSHLRWEPCIRRKLQTLLVKRSFVLFFSRHPWGPRWRNNSFTCHAIRSVAGWLCFSNFSHFIEIHIWHCLHCHVWQNGLPLRRSFI